MATEKLIEYAYPSSDTAKRCGYEAQGCWTVTLVRDGERCKATENAFATRRQAQKFAEELEVPFARGSFIPGGYLDLMGVRRVPGL